MNKLMFSPLTETGERWKAAQLIAARDLIARLCPGDAWDPIRIAALDRAWSVWIASRESENQEVNSAINAFGIAFGELLVHSEMFSWTIVSDEYGTDLGIRALPDRGDVSVVPADFVAKRWDRKETDFIADAYAAILDHVEKVKAE